MSERRDRVIRALAAAVTGAMLNAPATADDWPQWRGPNRDGVWRETGLRETLPEEPLPVRWSVPISAGYSGPSVAGDHVYVSDRVTEPTEQERVLCFDRTTGATKWSHAYDASYDGLSYDAGPRCPVLVHDGRVYNLGAVGHLVCLDAAKGTVLWSHDLREEYAIEMPIWGLAASPIVEGDTLIVPVSGAEAYLVAFDLATGKERWRALADKGNYASPIIVEQAGRRVLVIWTGERIVGVAPESGALLWEHPFPPKRMPLGCATPVVSGDTMFLTGFYDGCMLLRLAPDELAVEAVWKRSGPNEIRTDGIQSIISTPYIDGEHIYGVDSYGQLRCLRLSDGERVWEDLTAVPKARWATIHFVRHGERTWMFNERGELLLGRLTPAGFEELGRTKIIDPTLTQLNQREGVCWSHPAFAHGHVFARSDEKLVCVDLREPAP